MTMEPRPELAPPQMTPATPAPEGIDRPDAGQTPSERPQTFAPERPATEGEGGFRPQADFGVPIDVGPDTPIVEAPGKALEAPLTGGTIPPVFADADVTAEPHLKDLPPPQPLTVRIRQGRPSYSEPEPEIAGVVGRAARGGEGGPDLDDRACARPRVLGTP